MYPRIVATKTHIIIHYSICSRIFIFKNQHTACCIVCLISSYFFSFHFLFVHVLIEFLSLFSNSKIGGKKNFTLQYVLIFVFLFLTITLTDNKKLFLQLHSFQIRRKLLYYFNINRTCLLNN